MNHKPLYNCSHHASAWALFQAGRLLDAKQIYEKICRKSRKDDGAWLMLGIIHGSLAGYAEAEECLKRAIGINERNFDALVNLALVYHQKGMPEAALKYYKKALAINPAHADVLFQMGNVCARMDHLTLAENYYLRALALDPGHPLVPGNLANVMAYQGRATEAIAFYRKALQMNADSAGIHSNLLLCMHYPDEYDPGAVFTEHRIWSSVQTRGVHPYEWEPPDSWAARKLRVGYVTPDLREHSVAYFLKPILENHDRSRFEIYCYFESVRPEDTRNEFACMADVVRNTHGLSDDQAAAVIKMDGIDILVDLAGHTENNRLPVFARRPAPLQITYLGYPDTTGLNIIDYRITDHWADPPGRTEQFHSERLLRLETGFLCFSPPADSPEVTSLPSDSNGYITFGSFNVLTKITPEMLSIWGKLLTLMPEARLLIKNRQLTDERLKYRLREQFLAMGVHAERIELLGRTSKREHMATYGRVDIALDSYPYNGTTTTCDTLWMGIPVVTLAGASHVSRVGVSILSQVGLDELVTESSQEYVERAMALAANHERIREIRRGLRDTMRNSCLCNAEKFSRGIEALYVAVWEDWRRRVR